MSTTDSSINAPRRRLAQLLGVGCLQPWHWAGADSHNRLTLQASWLNDAESAGYLTALRQQYYSLAGLDLHYLPGGPGVDPLLTLARGNCDIALARPDAAINAIHTHGVNLKIIGAQYQKSPLGIVSLARRPITEISQLVGRRLAVAPFNQVYVDAVLAFHGVAGDQVSFVPYGYDPAILIAGECDACVDWISKLPYRIHLSGIDTASLLFYDKGLPLFDNVVVTTADTLASRRNDLVTWMMASRQGWYHNFADPLAAVDALLGTYFDNTPAVRERERFYNRAQQPLMHSEQGLFSMSRPQINACVAALGQLGQKVPPALFDTSVLGDAEVATAIDNNR